MTVQLEGDEVLVSFPQESADSETEAGRLCQRASKRAAEGDYAKAIETFKRVLEKQPSLHAARRDLAMAYVEVGDVDNATNHLIEVLRVDPQDAWSWVELANLYIRQKSDLDTGEKFLRKALQIKPDDAWALNSLAAVLHERGKSDEAIALFERAIKANPKFANPYHGEAIVYEAVGQPDKATAALCRLFPHAEMQDTRSRAVFRGKSWLISPRRAPGFSPSRRKSAWIARVPIGPVCANMCGN